ncbi:hypothetical protein [Ammoniphilus sp. 3BR4]|uniref:hypothetical protein n=1 Tax=Ammoniphilus sp. 3BR4 TaxID=3158265 RepID=UPI0034659254
MSRGKRKGYIEERSGKVRVNSSLQPEVYEKLDMLAAACGVSPTTLVNFFTELCLNNENIINYTQDQHRARSKFRVIPSKTDDGLQYILAEKRNRA